MRDKIMAVSCLDYRVQTILHDHLKANHDGHYDIVSIGGANLCLTCEKCPKYWRQTLIDNINIGIEVHDIKEIWLYAHENCGACKKFNIIYNETGKEEEYDIHTRLARKTRNMLKELYSNIKVKIWFINNLRDNMFARVEEIVGVEEIVDKNDIQVCVFSNTNV